MTSTLFYTSHFWINNYGSVTPEWVILVDGFIVLPLLCFACIESKKEAALKALAYGCLLVLLGSYVIPEKNKVFWSTMESGRYLILGLFVLVEIVTVMTVCVAIRAGLSSKTDPETAISQPIQRISGKSQISKILVFEARVWTYFLLAHKIEHTHFTGAQHYLCDRKDGTKTNMLGFILIIMFEIPILHAVLYFIWSPTAANIVSVLTIIGLVVFIAEYRAISRRPISLLDDRLIVRFGVFNPLSIPVSDIVSIEKNNSIIRRNKGVKRYNHSGAPNVKVISTSGEQIYLGVNNPQRLIQDVNAIIEMGKDTDQQ